MTDDEQVRCPVPRARPDVDRSVMALLRGYRFLPKLRAAYHADAIETGLLGQRVLCVSGAEGARLFYDESRMQRDGAVPAPLAAPVGPRPSRPPLAVSSRPTAVQRRIVDVPINA